MSEAQFQKAVEIIQSLPKDGPIKPTQDDQLHFYKYYKQVTVGDVNTARPGLLDFAGKVKWDAWDSVKGTSKEDAYKAYVDKFVEVFSRVDTDEAKGYIAQVQAA